ncbi:hypothetical protein ACFYM2_33625 [Streptomyces sp. NPDC006711]|uniref:hypothetical protein n=1 Tax=Streptomyces sp. NPDC006711 TaxID=3364762 RepID=UPI00369B4344
MQQRFPASLFSGGPVLRLLDIAIRAQESKGGSSLDDEIHRYVRVIRSDWIAGWNCSAYVASGMLELSAELVKSHADLSHLPPDFQEKLKRACGDMEPADYLDTLAGIVRIIDRQPPLEYDELPMSDWEFRQTFPFLTGLDAILMDEGDREFREIVQGAVTAEHPYCHHLASAYSAEAQRATILFPGADAVKNRLSWATRGALRELINAVDDHMQEAHS